MVNKSISVKIFETNQKGIDELKGLFIKEPSSFTYFRKGEWAGIASCVNIATDYIMQNPDILISSVSFALTLGSMTTTKKQIDRILTQKPEPGKVTKVICCERDRESKEIKEWCNIYGQDSVAMIPKLQSGSFRYLVNDKRFAIFSRLGKNILQGIQGTDIDIINMLKKIFEKEYNNSIKEYYEFLRAKN